MDNEREFGERDFLVTLGAAARPQRETGAPLGFWSAVLCSAGGGC
jgi:hypothetical protein